MQRWSVPPRHSQRAVAALAFLGSLLAVLVAGCSVGSPDINLSQLPVDSSVRMRPSTSDPRFGTAVSMDPRALRTPEYRARLTENFNSVTPENQMKWGVVEPEQGAFNFAPADALVRFARRNNMLVRGHTLLWHNSLPSWVTALPRDCAVLRPVLRKHIQRLVSRYSDVVDEWDVANEVFMDDGSLRTEQNPFLDACGERIIGDAFRWAREADPSATLYLNDYDVLMASPRMEAYVRLIRRMRAQGVPIGGFGVQGHMELGDPGIRDLPAVLREFGRLGLRTAVTEADVQLDVTGPQQVSQRDLTAQARAYRSMLRSCLTEHSCRNFTVWGFTDRYSWVPDAIQGRGAATMMNVNFHPKPAARALRDELTSAAPEDQRGS